MKLFFQLSWFFRQQWRRYLSAITLLIVVALLQLLPPKIVGVLVDRITHNHIDTKSLVYWVGLIVVSAIAIYVIRYLWRMMLFGASYQLAIQLRQRLYQHFSRHYPGFFLRHRTGDLMAHATNDVDRVVFAAGEGILTLVDSLVMGLAVLVIMSTQISWQLTLLALLPMPVMAVIIKRYGSQLHHRFRVAQEAFSTLNDQTQDTLTSIRMIKGFGLEQQQSQQFAAVANDVGHKNMQVARIDARFDPTIYVTVVMANVLAVGGGSWMVVNQLLTLGQLTSFIMYLGLMIWPMLALAWMFNIVERGSAAYERIASLLAEQPESPIGDWLPPIERGDLELDIRQFFYPEQSKAALTDIQAILKPGQMLGLCGPTGSGKSTLMALIQRQYTPQNGQITYHQKSLALINLDAWRSRLAVVSQRSFLFSTTVAENIALGRPQATEQQIIDAAKLASIHEDILQLPDGYQTQVGERGIMLSGGQKQRIAIARALLLDAEILLLDDALSAVDGQTEHNILHNLRQWGVGKTIIISAHRLSALVKANSILVLHEGKIAQQGTHTDLLNVGGWYSNMYRYQQLEAALDNDAGSEAEYEN